MDSKSFDANVSRRSIVKLAKILYGENTIKADAFRHILAAAYYTTQLGYFPAKAGGYLVEILGAVKSMIKLNGFVSGWKMDMLNNEIGFNMGKKYRKASFEELAEKTKILIEEGNFYNESGHLIKTKKMH
jgi:hypothetical protein